MRASGGRVAAKRVGRAAAEVDLPGPARAACEGLVHGEPTSKGSALSFRSATQQGDAEGGQQEVAFLDISPSLSRTA